MNITFLVQPRDMAIYAIVFAFGWLLYARSDLLTGFQRAAWTQVLIAVALAPLNFLSLGKLLRMHNTPVLLLGDDGTVLAWETRSASSKRPSAV